MVEVLTIPKKLFGKDDLVLIPRREYEKFLRLPKEKKITEKDVLLWAKEAKKLADQNKLPVLRSLRELR